MTNNNYKVFTYNCQMVIYKGGCIFGVGESLAKVAEKITKLEPNFSRNFLNDDVPI